MCFQNFIILRNSPVPTAKWSGLYLDDLPGISFNHTAEIIEDGLSVSDFINNKVVEACELTVQDALNYTPNGRSFPYLRTNQLSAIYHQSVFQKEVAQVDGEKGISFEMLRPDYYQHSNFVIERIYIKPTTSGTIDIKIKDGTQETVISNVAVTANETIELNSQTNEELPYTATSKKIEIVTAQDSDFYKAVFPSDGGCTSCGSRSIPNKAQYLDKKTMIEVKDGYGINAEVHIACSTDKIGCSIINYLRYAARFKTAMLLALEGKFTDRSNFYSFGADFDEMLDFYQIEYDKQMRSVIPNLARIIKMQDTNCFSCGGLKTSTVVF